MEQARASPGAYGTSRRVSQRDGHRGASSRKQRAIRGKRYRVDTAATIWRCHGSKRLHLAAAYRVLQYCASVTPASCNESTIRGVADRFWITVFCLDHPI